MKNHMCVCVSGTYHNNMEFEVCCYAIIEIDSRKVFALTVKTINTQH